MKFSSKLKKRVKVKSRKNSLIREFYKGNIKWFSLALIFHLLCGLMNIVISWILKVSIDIVTGVSDFDFAFFIIILIASILITIVFMYLISYFNPKYVKNAMQNYKNNLIKAIMSKDISNFKKVENSAYISLLTNDASAIEEKYVKNTIILISDIITMIASLGLMIYFSPLMTLISILLSLFPVIMSLITGGKLAAIEKNISEDNASFVSTISDFANGFTLVKNFKSEDQIAKRIIGRNNQLEENKRKSNVTRKRVNMLGSASSLIAQFGVIIVGMFFVLKDSSFTAGMLISFVNLMNFIISPIINVPVIYSERKAAKALIEKAAKMIELPDNEKEGEKISYLQDEIKLESISFSYESGKDALKDVNLEFKNKKSYAIVGGSGSGKSTLLKVLMREIKPTSGTITYDDMDFNQISLDSLYERMTLIQQNIFIFNASILDNITMFENFDKDEITMAINKASLTSLIAEKGYSYMCGENGVNLSGGEKQRIAIARALLKNSSIILTDEATASLDRKTAFQVTKDILALADKTRIMVTHSLDKALLEGYDEIIVLKNGRVEEKGKFDELIKLGGYFKSLYLVGMDN